jgi:hypothetical protein
MGRVKIHTDGQAIGTKHCIAICTMDGFVLSRCRRVVLTGRWVLRQYNNPVPCGAKTVLYTEDETSTYEVVK